MSFPTTSWSLICELKDPASPRYRQELERLVQIYWAPVHGVIRQFWARSDEDAKDLAQEFFARATLEPGLLDRFDAERGSFRTFLRAALKHFMLNANRDAERIKRGGGVMFVPFEATAASGLSPEQVFDATWNKTVFDRALASLEARLGAEGRAQVFTLFKRYDLENEGLSYAELGRDFGLSGDQVKHTLVSARAAFREALVEVVRGYVEGPDALARELEQLFRG